VISPRLKVNRYLKGTSLALGVMMALGVSVQARAVTTTRIASGLNSPLYVTMPTGDFNRLFIVEQHGRIRILKNGALLDSAFLNVDPISVCCNERGLLGLAFHPNYAHNGFFYINYIDLNGNTVIARYHVSADPDIADPASGVTLKTYTQPETNHKGGCLVFGPDGMLYAGAGDGGGANDQHGTIGNGQKPDTYLGKILRLDVDAGPPYVPADNPFVGTVDTFPEIWDLGMRNPWRFSFDRLTNAMYIGDVGQDTMEEIDYEPPGSTGGRNYGWRCMEGTLCTGMTGCTCNAPNLTLPINTYFHTGGNCNSITGGYVYRGCALPELYGDYFYAEYCNGHIWSFRYDGVSKTDSTEWTTTLAPGGGLSIASISSFGQDNYGELYICDYADGEVYKIVPNSYADCDSNRVDDSCQIAMGISADVNSNGIPDACEVVCACACAHDPACDGVTDILDVATTINVAFRGAAAITDGDCPAERTDVDCTGTTDILDVTHIINVAFRGGAVGTEFCIPCNCHPFPVGCP